MSDHSSPSRQGLAPSKDEDRSPDSRDPSDDELDQMDDDDTEDEGEDGMGKQEEKEITELGADTFEDEHASDEEKTSDLFPPTPRSLSRCPPPPEEPQPLGLNRRFGMSSFDDYELVKPDQFTGICPTDPHAVSLQSMAYVTIATPLGSPRTINYGSETTCSQDSKSGSWTIRTK